jgi:hypothetical protein
VRRAAAGDPLAAAALGLLGSGQGKLAADRHR